jgi:large subunit ribosomal protein L6
MSRIGKKPITIPKGVDLQIAAGNVVTVKGPKGSLMQALPESMVLNHADGQVVVSRPSDEKEHRALHGLTRTLLSNMVEGVTTGYARVLEILGVGYRAAREGKNIVVFVGYSHPIRVVPPEGISFEIIERKAASEPQQVIVRGIDKQLVGEQAAKIRALRPPEPYKGYGIKFQGERVRRKAGKAGKAK